MSEVIKAFYVLKKIKNGFHIQTFSQRNCKSKVGIYSTMVYSII